MMEISDRHVRRLCAGADLSPSTPVEADVSRDNAAVGQRRGDPPEQDPATGRFNGRGPYKGGRILVDVMRRLNGYGGLRTPERDYQPPTRASAAFAGDLIRDEATGIKYDPADPADVARKDRCAAEQAAHLAALTSGQAAEGQA